MSDIEWAEPPATKAGGGRSGGKHRKIADQLREHPGKWALIGRSMAPSMVTQIRKGLIAPYAPAGSFEAVGRNYVDKRCDLYVRFVGEGGAA